MKRTFILTVENENGFNEDIFTVNEAVENAIENEAQDNVESPLFDCKFSVKEIKNPSNND